MFALPQVLLASATIGGVFCDDLRINSADDLIKFSEDVNSGTSYAGTTVLLDVDLDFTGKILTPIGNNNKYFQGTFDGQGHVISNLNISSDLNEVGLFGYSDGGTTIKNIVLDDSCSVEGNSSSSDSDITMGGVLGMCMSSDGQCTIEGSVNMASVSFRGSTNGVLGIGGIAGVIYESNEIIIKNCANYGSVTNYGSADDINIGGIVGICLNNIRFKKIQNCVNYGRINYTNAPQVKLYVGGVVGYSDYTAISNCLSGGKISGNGDGIGSIVGFVYSSTTIEHCYWTNEAWSGNSYGMKESETVIFTETDTSKVTSPKEALDSLNPQVTSENGWNEWFTLHLNGGKINNLEQEELIVATKPFPEPVKVGDSFMYWCMDAECKGRYDPKTMTLTKSSALYAKWSAKQYTITFMSDGSVIKKEVLVFGSIITYPSTPFKTGYTFAGWDSDIETMPGHDVTINATWTPNQYTITFNSNGGDTCGPITQDYGTSFTLPTPTRTGYTFNYWCSNSALSTQYTETTMPARNMTLYAKWTINQYTVAFMSDGSVIKSETLDYGSTITYPENPSKEGYTFAGWDSDIETVPAYNATINATWTVNKYTVIFDVNGGNTLPVQSKEVAYNDIYGDLPEPAKTGHSFVGWFSDKGSESEEVTRASKYNITRNQTLYAHWAINSYTITFDFSNGTITNSLFQFNETITYPDNLERDNYTFNGWDPKPERMRADNITVKAQWNETRREEKKISAEGSEYVEIVFGKKDLSEEEAKEIIGKYANGEEFTIVRFDDGKDTGDVVVIIKFVDQEKAANFIETIKTTSEINGDFVKDVTVLSFSTSFKILSPLYLFI